MALITLPPGVATVDWTPPPLAEYVSKSSYSGKATIINRGGVTGGFRAKCTVVPCSNDDMQAWKAFAALTSSKANLFRLPAVPANLQAAAPTAVATFGTGVTANQLLQSGNLAIAPWSTAGLASVTAVPQFGPNGAQDTSFFLSENTTTGEHRLQQVPTLIAGQPFCFSVLALPSNRFKIRLNSQFNFAASFDLSTGTIIGGFTGIAAGIEVDDFGWHRCWVAGDVANATTGISIVILDNSNNVSYTGVNGNGVYVFQPQVEFGTRPSPFIQNAGAIISSFNGVRLSGLPVNSTVLRRGAMVSAYDRLYTLTQDLQTGAAGTATAIVSPQLGRLSQAGDVSFLRSPFARMRMTSPIGWADLIGYGRSAEFECEEAL